MRLIIQCDYSKYFNDINGNYHRSIINYQSNLFARTFKAIKSTSRTQVLLVVVIVISFSWSAYALFKIALGNADTSVLGFSIAKQTAPTQQTDNNESVGGNSQAANSQVASQLVTPSPEMSPREQLALYKSEILKELLARQREILEQKVAPVGLEENQPHQSSPTVQLPNNLVNQNQRRNSDAIEFERLKQWSGRSVLPNIVNNLLSNNSSRNVASPKQSRFVGTNVSNGSPARTLSPPSSVIIDESPSLGQLSSRANRLSMLKTEARLRDKEASPSLSSAIVQRLPEESTVSEDLEEDTARIATTTTTSTTTTTTTAAPSISETTSEPNSSDDGEQSNGSAETSTEEPASSENASDEEETPEEEKEDNNQAQSDKMDRDSFDRARKAVTSIDDEVDRMTQSSVGSISRRSDPIRSAVQFDDQIIEPPLHIGREISRQEVGALTKSANDTDPTRQDPLEVADLDPPIRPQVSAQKSISPADRIPPRPATKRRVGVDSRVRQRRATPADVGLVTGFYDSPAESKVPRREGLVRRRNDHEDGDSDDQEDEGQQEESPQSEPYDYITQGEPSLQELIAHKQLLDSLRQSRLPAPVVQHSNSSSKPTNSDGSNQQLMQTAGAMKGHVDHKPAAQHLYSIDEGLLLTPASDEEHEHKSVSHKKEKKKESKSKHKSTMGSKKGGHKEKEHKKEEKKYLKEKKFKGAKKGKKVSKGKGGKGGKKGSKHYKDKGFKKKGFKNIYVKNEFGQKKSYFDEFRDKDFKKKWKNFDDKYNYAQMKKWQAKDVKGAKKMKDEGKKYKKYDKGKWKKMYQRKHESNSSKKKKKYDHF